MQIQQFFERIGQDISDLYNNEVPKIQRGKLINSVAIRVLGLLGLTLAAAIFVGSAILLSFGNCGAFLPLVGSATLGILNYDWTVIGDNRSQLIPRREPFAAVVAGAQALRSLWDNSYPELKGTLIIGPLMHCASRGRAPN